MLRCQTEVDGSHSPIIAVNSNTVQNTSSGLESEFAIELKIGTVIVRCDDGKVAHGVTGIDSEQGVEGAPNSINSHRASHGGAPREPNRSASWVTCMSRFARLFSSVRVRAKYSAPDCRDRLGELERIIVPSTDEKLGRLAVNGSKVVAYNYSIIPGLKARDICERCPEVCRADHGKSVKFPLVRNGRSTTISVNLEESIATDNNCLVNGLRKYLWSHCRVPAKSEAIIFAIRDPRNTGEFFRQGNRPPTGYRSVTIKE